MEEPSGRPVSRPDVLEVSPRTLRPLRPLTMQYAALASGPSRGSGHADG